MASLTPDEADHAGGDQRLMLGTCIHMALMAMFW
jgi:hypothetical protein